MTSTPAPRPVRLLLVGAGNRGQSYVRWVHAHPELARLGAVADPRSHQRDLVAAGDASVEHFADWREVLERGERVADAVIIATQDRQHVEPAIAFAEAGYAILMEKPLAPTEAESRRIVEAVTRTGVLFGVCHVMRYMPYTDLVKEVVDSGVLGEIVTVQHLEPVGWWHMAHSYVRGPWRREDQAAPMLLAKSSHDLDWIRYVTGKRIAAVSSFGSRHHFRAENRPPTAADRCLDCPLQHTCPYAAQKLYVETFRREGAVWPVTVITDRTDEAGVIEALRTGPYGRCVYASDNTVVDNQVLSFRFDDGTAGTFVMTAFSEQTHRRTHLFGTHGSLEGDGESVRVVDFRTGEATVREVGPTGAANAGGDHGGGDGGVMAAFVGAVATGDASLIRSGPRESLDSHLAVFAAERSRHEGRIVEVPQA
ncbi:Gfo/Idh/MocA family oxidoreductase [Herbiconiux sp.]|uniref:Gfo/Idh/MocA family protein n=1 Tax=Herbiconiux sp. TaxID=1871186 RepID=UPI0025C0C9C5|nr:Gfo/Idh/MocA family oxidoreductase [Herbiconiux sp.]